MAEKHIHYHNGAQPPKPTFERKAQSLKKIMLIFIIIIFSGMLLAYSVSDIPEAYVSEMVGINDDKLNTPIAELNGLSLNEVFENANEISFDNWTNQSGNSEHLNILSEGVFSIKRISGTLQSAIALDLSIQPANWYISVEVKADFLDIISYIQLNYISGTSGQVRSNLILSNEYQQYSKIVERLDTNGIYYITQSLSLIPVDKTLYFKNIYGINLNLLGIDNLTKEQMDYYYEQYKTYKDTNMQVKVYKDNWTLEQKEKIGTGGLTAVTGFMRQVEKVGITIGTAKDIFVHIIENDIIRTISNTLQDISNGIRDFFEWVSNNLGFENKLPPITLPIPPINP